MLVSDFLKNLLGQIDKKIQQHYVPRFYLKTWGENGKIWRLRDGNIRHCSLRRVASEPYFYQVQNLEPADIYFLQEFINRLPEVSRPVHRNLLDLFSKIDAIKRAADPTQAHYPALDALACNFEENYHEKIENFFRPALDSMLAGNTNFYSDDKAVREFLYAICIQYMRTKKRREALIAGVKSPLPGVDIRRISNILCHILATQLGASLYVDRGKFRVLIIENHTDTPFITGDQPLINLHANLLEDNAPPEKFEFFYPLSPAKAMLLVECSNPMCPLRKCLSVEDVRGYNKLIAENAHEQIFSNSKNSLIEIRLIMQK
jgi:hypothetical protein